MADLVDSIPSSLGLLHIPYVAHQLAIVDFEGFRSAADDWGVSVSREQLRRLHLYGLLAPIFVELPPPGDPSRMVAQPEDDGSRIGGAASAGLLVDPFDRMTGGRLAPLPEKGRAHYATTQALDLKSALQWMPSADDEELSSHFLKFRRRARLRQLAIVALSGRHLPGLTKILRMEGGTPFESIQRARFEVPETVRLGAVGFSPEALVVEADEMLLRSSGRSDPMSEWWQLIRHAGPLGWDRMRGAPARAVWDRVHAEVLLRAHEYLETDGVLRPLRDISQLRGFTPQHDRLHPKHRFAESLPRALALMGLSPTPRAVIAVEGRTEQLLALALLEELDIEPRYFRIVTIEGSKSPVHQIARHLTAPRVGALRGDYRLFDGVPTALFVAMDNENLWADDKIEATRDSLRGHLSSEVVSQGAELSTAEVDALLNVRNWGKARTFELANFTDAELARGMLVVARSHGQAIGDKYQWLADARSAVAFALANAIDISSALGRMKVGDHKPELARALRDTLTRKLRRALRDGSAARIPVIRLAFDVLESVQTLSGSSYVVGEVVNPHGETS